MGNAPNKVCMLIEQHINYCEMMCMNRGFEHGSDYITESVGFKKSPSDILLHAIKDS